MTFRIREDLKTYLLEQAEVAQASRTAIVERALVRDLRAERRRLAQEAAIMEADNNREFAELALRAAREAFPEQH